MSCGVEIFSRPSAAALGSGLYLSFVAAGLFVLGRYGWLGAFTAFLLMGCGSILASGVLLWRLGLVERETADELGATWRAVLRENWIYGRWLVGSAVLFSISSQTQMFLAAGILGLGTAGILRAMQIPSLVMVQIITAAGLLVLPSFSYDFGRERTEQLRHKAMLVSFGLAVAAFCFVATLALLAGRTEHLLFGGKYAAYAWLMPVLALVPVASGISMGYSMALRASQKPRFDFISNMFAAPVAMVSAFFLMRWWGLAGAAASMTLSFSVLTIVTIVFFQRSARDPGGMTRTKHGQAVSLDVTNSPWSFGERRVMGQFLNTIQQIVHCDSVEPFQGICRHLHWQVRKALHRFPCELAIAGSRLHVDRPGGVAALVNAMGEYDFNNMRFLKLLLSVEGGTFIDIGANIGVYTLIASEVANARVVSVEPHPTTFALLKENVRLNARRNVSCLNAALSDRVGELQFTDYRERSVNRVISAGENGVSELCVASRRFDVVYREFSALPDFVKIDVEGHECAVLEGFGDFQTVAKIIFIEGGERQEVRNWMKAAGYTGPWFVHFNDKVLSTGRQRRPEDPLFVHTNYVPELSNINFDLLDPRAEVRISRV